MYLSTDVTFRYNRIIVTLTNTFNNLFQFLSIVWLQKMSILPPQKGLETLKDWDVWSLIHLELLEEWGGLWTNPFHGGGMDNFWNYTLPRTGPGIPCKNAILSQCVLPEMAILPPQKGLEISWGGGLKDQKILKKCMKFNWNFQMGWGFL